MIKQTIIAVAAIGAAVFAFQPEQAQAGTKLNFHIGVGSPYHGYYGRPYYGGSSYYGGGSYYGGPTYYGAPAYRPRRHYRVGCRQARRILRNSGYHRIRTRECRGRSYTFKARRHGDWWVVKVSSRTGRIIRARPI